VRVEGAFSAFADSFVDVVNEGKCTVDMLAIDGGHRKQLKLAAPILPNKSVISRSALICSG
jgi:hypothetical protein